MPHTLLLADDSVTIQRVIELTFADEDIRVIAVSDGDQAIAALDKAPPDIVLADVGMPGRDGYQVAQHIKVTPRLSHIPVLLLTGAFEPIDQARAAEVGCDGVLAKPFEPQLVIGRVKELLSKPKVVAPSLDAPLAPPAPPWVPGLDDVSRAPVSPLAPHEDVDQYFDRLDRAFASLSEPAKDGASKPAARPVADEIDWFSTTAPPPGPPPQVADRWDAPASSAPPVDLPIVPPLLAPAAAAPGFSREVEVPLPPSAARAVAPASAARVEVPPLADAFAALLAAEQSVPPPPAAAWPQPVSAPAAPAMAAAISEEVIDDIVRRVLGQLSDKVVRETVSDIVSNVAERLVREEIERIKNTNT